MVHEENAVRQSRASLGYPVVLKEPDAAFSQGVVKVDSEAELEQKAEDLLDKSDLIIAQEFLPTTFDWRIAVFDGQPLFACKYHMAHRHWQIIKDGHNGQKEYGRFDTMPVEIAPYRVVRTALKAANLNRRRTLRRRPQAGRRPGVRHRGQRQPPTSTLASKTRSSKPSSTGGS